MISIFSKSEISKFLFFSIGICLTLSGCNTKPGAKQAEKVINNITEGSRRFFSDESFWNQPIPNNPEIDPRSDQWVELLNLEPSVDHFAFNATEWTIPVYEVDSTTSVYDIKPRLLDEKEKKFRISKRDYYGFGPGFRKDVPIPDNVNPDPEADAHFAVVDWNRRVAWDMWGAIKHPDGTWSSFTGMKYPLDGNGVFDWKAYEGIKDDESVHFHAPSRAAGVPAISSRASIDA